MRRFLILFLTVLLGLSMAQYARPDGDITVGNWSPYPADPTTLFDKIDEVTKNDDTDYMVSSTDEDECEVSLTNVTDPEVGTGHIIRCYAKSPAGAGAGEQMWMALVENGNVRGQSATVNVSRTAYGLIEYTLSEAEANAITNYANLRLRFHITKTDADEPIRITQAELEVPSAGYSLTCDSGSLGIAGQAMGILKSNLIGIGSDSYAIAGQVLGAQYSRIMSLGGSSYVTSGQSLSFFRSYLASIGIGNYAISGQVMSPKYSRIFSLGAETYAISGQAAGLYFNRLIPIGSGAYVLTGSDVTLVYTPVSGEYSLICDAGAYALTGQVLGLLKSNIIQLASDTYGITGQDIGTYYSRLISIASGTFILTGSDVTLTYTPTGGEYSLICDAGIYALTGQDIEALRDSLIQAEAGSYLATGQTVLLIRDAKIFSDSGEFILTGKDIDFKRAFLPAVFDIRVLRGHIKNKRGREIVFDVRALREGQE